MTCPRSDNKTLIERTYFEIGSMFSVPSFRCIYTLDDLVLLYADVSHNFIFAEFSRAHQKKKGKHHFGFNLVIMFMLAFVCFTRFWLIYLNSHLGGVFGAYQLQLTKQISTPTMQS